MFELMDAHSQSAVIKVIGVGGGGGNAVAHMVNSGIEGVDFICANTDAQALNSARVRTALQIGCNITKGLGAGANPDVGRQAVLRIVNVRSSPAAPIPHTAPPFICCARPCGCTTVPHSAMPT